MAERREGEGEVPVWVHVVAHVMAGYVALATAASVQAGYAQMVKDAHPIFPPGQLAEGVTATLALFAVWFAVHHALTFLWRRSGESMYR